MKKRMLKSLIGVPVAKHNPHNPMLKQINPEDLVVGREYYVKMEFKLNDRTGAPYCFNDVKGNERWFHENQPIYTLEQTSTDTDLEMLVNVASSLYVAHGIVADGIEKFMPSKDEIAREALDIITACKNALKEGER